MQTSAQYLDQLIAMYGFRSDYALSNALGCSRQAVSNYRLCLAGFDGPIALRVAELLNIPPGPVLLDMQWQRTRDSDVKDVWSEIAAAFAPALPRTPARTPTRRKTRRAKPELHA